MHRLFCPEGELATARAAARAGTVFIVSMTATTSLEAIAAEVPEARRWFQLYMQSDRGLTRELCRRAAAAGYEALCVTVDAPVVARMRRFEGGVFAVPPDLPLPNLDVADPGRGGPRPRENWWRVSTPPSPSTIWPVSGSGAVSRWW